MVPIPLGEERKVVGAEGLAPAELLAALDAGARVVAYRYVLSVVHFSLSGSKLYLIPPGKSSFRAGFDRTLVTLLGGWWSIPGLIETPVAIVSNCLGGKDATGWVRACCLEDMAKAEQAAVERVAMLELPIDTPEARADRAMFFLSEGDVDGAWELISQDVSRPDPQLCDLPRLRRLLLAFHDKKAWDPALRLGVVIARAFPADARVGYLAMVLRRIEAENGVKPGTIVPPPSFWNTGRGAAVILGSLAAALVALLIALNLYLREHATLHVVNGHREAIDVSIPGATPASLHVEPGRLETFTLPEGRHQARVVHAGAERTIDVPLEVGFVRRFLPAIRVLNPGGAAALVRLQVVYTAPNDPAPPVDPPRFHFGEEYLDVPDATGFGEPPPTTSLQRGQVSVVTRVVQLQGHPAEVADRLPDWPSTLAFLELHARLSPDDADLLEHYVRSARSGAQVERAAAFLDEGLARRPWSAAWCLARVRLLNHGTREIVLPRSLLPGADPDAQALALAARASADGAEARTCLEQARAQAPADPLVLLALAEARLREGDLAAVADLLDGLPDGPERRAVRQELARRGPQVHLDRSHADLSARARRVPYDLSAARDLLELEALRGDAPAVDRNCQRLRQLWATGEQAEQAAAYIRRLRALVLGDPAELLALDRLEPEPGLRLVAHLLRDELDQAERAAREAGPDPALALEHTLLAAALAARGDERAPGVVELARAAWGSAGPRGEVAAALIDERERVGDDDLLRLTLSCAEVEAVRLLAAASQPGEARGAIVRRLSPPRGPGYPAAVLRAVRELVAGR